MSILSELQSKKLQVLELIALSYNLYLKNIRIFLALNCTVLPFFVIISTINPNSFGLLFSAFYLVFYYFIFIPLYSASICILVENCVLNKEIQIGSSIRKIRYFALPILSLSIRFILNFSGRVLLFIIPGIIYYMRNQFFIPALVLRNQVGKATFQYSRMLVRGNWWRVVLYNFVIYIASFGLFHVVTKITKIFIGFPLLAVLVSLVLYIFVSFGVSISGVLLFLNLDFQKRQ